MRLNYTLFIVFAMLLLLPTVMAVDFDNVKRFAQGDVRSLSVKNSFGFGEEIASVKLETPLYHYVPAGSDVQIAELTVDSAQAYLGALQQVESYSMRGGERAGKQSGRAFWYKVKSTERVEVPVYGNGKKQIGTEWVEQTKWTPIEDGNLPKGEVTIGIFTNTQQGEVFDYVPTLFGVKVDEWAIVQVTETIQGGAWATNSLSNARGWNITVQEPINVTQFIMEASVSGATRALIRNDANTVTLFSTTTLVGQTFFFGGAGANLSPGNYRFLVDDQGSDYNARRLTGEALPQDTGAILWVQGANEEITDDGFSIQSIVYNVSRPSIGNVTLTNPANNSAFMTLTGVTFNATAGVAFGTVVNATMFLYDNAGSLLQTIFTDHVPGNKSNFSLSGLFSDGNYRWNIQMCTDQSDCARNNTNFTFTLDSGAPSLVITSPANESYIYSYNASNSQFVLNISLADLSPGSCAFNSTFNSALTVTACNANRQVNLTNVFGKHTIYAFGNDTAGNSRMNQSTIWIHRNVFSNETYETDSTTISLELWNMTDTPNSAVLFYNGSNHTPTVTNLGNSKYTLNTTLDVPIGVGNKSFINFYNDGVARASAPLNQQANLVSFSICSGESLPKYLNITFRNETVAQERVSASIASSFFGYWLGGGSVVKNYTFSTVTEHANYTFCFSPTHRNLTLSESVSYSNTLSAQRTFSATLGLSNSTTQQTLFLLPNTLGIFVTFQVINPALQPIEGVAVNISSSTFGPIETKITDASGAATFFLNPLINYNIVATKTGLPTYTTSLTPTQTDYTITMGVPTTNTTVQDYFRGIVYNIGPSPIYLSNGTSYEFNFTISSSFWTLDRFGMSVRNASGSQFGTNSSTANLGGTVSLNRNVGRNQTIIVDAYWIIQGNSTNVSKTFIVFDASGTGTSLANLRDRIRLYVTTGGFFGLTPFGLNILVFLTIFITTGIVSYKFGFTSPFAVFGFMFIMTWILDYMNLITYASGLPEDAASLMVGILLLAFGIREAAS